MLHQYTSESVGTSAEQSPDWDSDELNPQHLHAQSPHQQRPPHLQHLHRHHIHHHKNHQQGVYPINSAQRRQYIKTQGAFAGTSKVAPPQQSLNSNPVPNAHCHLIETNQQGAWKMLGIDTYKTDNLIKTQSQSKNVSNSIDKQVHQPRPQLSSFQHRCIHAVADMIACPHTYLPSSIGVFLHPEGTRRGAFNKQLSAYLKAAYRRIDKKPKAFQVQSDLPGMLAPAFILILLGYSYGLLFGWLFGLSIGITSTVLYVLFVVVALIGGLQKKWKVLQLFAETLSRYSRAWSLVASIVFLRPAVPNHVPGNVRIIPLRLKLSNEETPWNAAARLSENMWTAAESKFSKTLLRLQYACEDSFEESSAKVIQKQRFRKVCCCPTWICLLVNMLATFTSMTVLRIHYQSTRSLDDLSLASKTAAMGSGVVALLTLTMLLIVSRKSTCRLIQSRSRFSALKRAASQIQTENSSLNVSKRPDVFSDLESSSGTDCEAGCSHHSRQTRETSSQNFLLPSRSEDARLTALEGQLRSINLRTCQTLHLLDARCDRQSRFLISVDVTGCDSLKLVADFCQIIRRVLMTLQTKAPGGNLRLDELNRRCGSQVGPCVPNVSLLIVCHQNGAKIQSLNATFSERHEESWARIHDCCNLRIYLDEPPLGLRLPLPQSANPHASMPVSSHRLVRGEHRSVGPGATQETLAFPDCFIGGHPLADINLLQLQDLVSHLAFLGRMLKTSEYECLSVLLETAATWLCLVVHWPFHATWICLSLEEHFFPSKRSRKKNSSNSSSSDDESNDVRHGSGNFNSNKPVLPTDTLSMLYSRVMERLDPALEECRFHLQTASSQHALSSQHRYGVAGMPSSLNDSSTSIALSLCSFSANDYNPKRLADFLLNKHRRLLAGGNITVKCPTDVTVRELAAVMVCSPFLNPRGKMLIRVRRSLQSLRSCDHQRLQCVPPHRQPPPPRPPPKPSSSQSAHCPVKLKTGVPKKPLSKMTVDDICRLVADISDLSTNKYNGIGRRDSLSLSDSITSSTLESPPRSPRDLSTIRPQPSQTNFISYLMKLRALNISGAVLTVCGLTDSLREEIGMTHEDWIHFCNLIHYLKLLEGRSCQCTRSMSDLGAHVRASAPLCRPRNGLSTSESILAIATRLPSGSASRYSNDSSPSPLGSRESSSISTNGSRQWSQRNTDNAEEAVCRLSGGSCSVYSADLSCSSFSSVASSGPDEPIRMKPWRNGVDV